MTSISPIRTPSTVVGAEETPFTREDLKAHVSQSKPPIELLLIQENADLKKLGDGLMKAILSHLKRENHALSSSLQEQLSQLTQQAEAMNNAKSWNFLSTIATSVLSFFGLIAGAQLGSVYLVAAGTTSLASTLITHCNGWNWVAETLASENEEAKATIRTLMPITMMLLSLGLGMNGAQLAGGTAQQMMQSLQHLKAYTFGAVQAGQAYNSYNQGKLDAQVVGSEAEIKMHDKKVYALSRELKNWLDLTRELSSLSKQSVKQTIRVTNAAAAGA